jgi:hypothetical protein
MKGEKFMEEILSNGLNIIPNITRRVKEMISYFCNLVWKVERIIAIIIPNLNIGNLKKK